jgi:hypothetical protein
MGGSASPLLPALGDGQRHDIELQPIIHTMSLATLSIGNKRLLMAEKHFLSKIELHETLSGWPRSRF